MSVGCARRVLLRRQPGEVGLVEQALGGEKEWSWGRSPF